ncbi:tyrosine-type recombinase/integrase [Alkalihalobacillus hemicellulosilyticus]|uniref:Site-specific recombinase XerD n=1 Tax=Halalkalibacter hemicellulosilyticusJCM 9152 TaxID=1236971 RepID=W4QL42_9BACI|nr:tyrosine-type recombinase/integrase [Halalkalibacter hemicellulosilyticus]GAE32806.1 site-specific recombinase XerD [Halalkalibacter hemicellulosilyticusJCM 9152]
MEALEEFLYLKQAQGLRKATITGYKNHEQHFFQKFPDSWRSSELKKAIYDHMSDDIKPATYNLRLIYLRAFFNWCMEEGYLSQNPLNHFKKRKASPRIVDIPDEALQKLLNCPDVTTFSGLRDYALIMLTLDSGIRPAEAFGLMKEDFDLSHYMVTVPEHISKTNTPRILNMLPQTAKVIHSLLKAHPSDWDRKTPVFCNNEGEVMDRHSWNRRLKKYSDEIDFKIRPYDLRHAFALRFLGGGGHAFALQRILGHTDMSMTRRYIHLTGDDLQETHREASPLNSLLPKKKKRIRKL